jgi:hypothetical protein
MGLYVAAIKDHKMGLYVAAIGNVLGLQPKVGPQQMRLPPAVVVNEAEHNAAFLESVLWEIVFDLSSSVASRSEQSAAESNKEQPRQDPAELLQSAEAKVAKGDLQGALADLNTALELQPTNADVWRLRSVVEQRLRSLTFVMRDAASTGGEPVQGEAGFAAKWVTSYIAVTAVAELDDVLCQYLAPNPSIAADMLRCSAERGRRQLEGSGVVHVLG